jgi:pimeloyl-ACP methyl ester carboxylesterase
MNLRQLLIVIVIGLASVFVASGQDTRQGRQPIIIIPGLTGSELVNRETGELVWFRVSRSKNDDVRLPISPNLSRNRDSLIPRDIIRGIKIASFLPEVEIYERLLAALKANGYHEAKWDTTDPLDTTDSYFVYAYDWRRDNVESARELIRRIESLKNKLKARDLKFNVISHSMGGLIARYAAMYGDADIPAGRPKPNWAGGRHFDRIFLLGTPNEGSVSALDALLNGVDYIAGINLPWVQNLSRYDLFTLPSLYQLLPQEGSFRAYDENLEPISLDIYEPETWEEYNWAIWQDKGFTKKFSPAEQRAARAYFRAALLRARRFQEALNANGSDNVPVRFHLIGADCKDTPAGIVLRRNEKKDRWITQFDAAGFTNSSGRKLTAEEVKKVVYSSGDGVVPKSSLSLNTLLVKGKSAVLPIQSQIFRCELHSKLVTNAEVQQELFHLLSTTGAR